MTFDLFYALSRPYSNLKTCNMRQLLPAYVLFGWCMLSTLFGAAQTSDSTLTRLFTSDALLPVLIDSACTYAPMIKRIQASERQAEANLKTTRKQALNALSFLSSYNYGTNFTAVNQAVGSGVSNLTTAQTGFYNIGLGIQLPITHLLSRKQLIAAGKAQIEMAQEERHSVALVVKQEVIRLYQAFKLAFTLMQINNTNRQAAKVNYTLAEKEFLNGQLTVEQLSRVQDLTNRATIDYQTSVNQFQTAFLQLEAYTGVNLTKLIYSKP